MPKYTTNYGLTKPLQTESYDVDVFNKNMDTLDDVISKLALKLHPIGSIYTTTDGTNPSTIFGGTWEQIKGKFLLGVSETYTNGSTGGEATHTLTIEETPSHSHSGTTNSAGNHRHGTWGEHYDGPMGNYDTSAHGGSGGDWDWDNYLFNTTYDGTHTHTFTTNSVGGGQAHNNMPPYLAVYMWKRTA